MRMSAAGEPRAERMARTERAARGSTSMGMVGQAVRRRGCNLRWSVRELRLS